MAILVMYKKMQKYVSLDGSSNKDNKPVSLLTSAVLIVQLFKDQTKSQSESFGKVWNKYWQ